MKLIKNVRAGIDYASGFTMNQIKKQRESMEFLSGFAYSNVSVFRKRICLGSLRSEIIQPARNYHPGKAVLYCHGGAFTCGDLRYAGILGTKIARSAHVKVYTFAYRLAPEHKYPAALNDAIKMWKFLMSRHYKAEDIILAGDSAGGNIMLELALKLKKRKIRPAGMILFSPFTDMTVSSASYKEWEEYDPILNKEYVISARDTYLGEGITDYDNEKYSPLFANLKGMPPTLIQAGSNEILLDDSIKLARKMKKSGDLVKLQVFQGGWHVFQQMPGLLSRRAMKYVGEFIYWIYD